MTAGVPQPLAAAPAAPAARARAAGAAPTLGAGDRTGAAAAPMPAPGYQATLFAPAPAPGAPRWRVVEASGRRHPATPSLALATGQARSLALADGRAWIVDAADRAVEVAAATTAVAVVDPRGPGWPATVERILARCGGRDARSTP